jgi:hypothetical protein
VGDAALRQSDAIPFEIVVMENALYAVTQKFNLNLSRIKQAQLL